jgi:hypothetical protein
MDDNLDLVGLPPEEAVARLLERRPEGYGLDNGIGSPDGPRPWWKFWEPKQEDAAVAWRRHVEESRARRRPVERSGPEPADER